ncbi:AsmA family protein [uncultured Marinobacter sp.]|uniref:AsmA family protein n=1 Tax=uncultured Marinobacter sp. TaxID=187379 RepID=UPI0030D9AD0B
MMTKPIRITLLAISLLAALLVVAALLAWMLFDSDRVKAQLEARLGDALGMEVKIGEPPGFSLFPYASVTLADIEVSREGQAVATAESARVQIELGSLLTGTVRPTELHLQRPTLSIERLSPGVFNIYESSSEPGSPNELSLQRLQVSEAQVNYVDRTSGLEWQFDNCDLDLQDIHHSGSGTDDALAAFAAHGELECQTLRQGNFTVSDLSMEIHGDNGVFDLDPISANVFEGQASGQLEMDLTSSTPEFSLTGELSGFEISAFMAMLAPGQTTTGTLDLELSLNAQGGNWQAIRDSTAGNLSMTGGGLELQGFDLDEELGEYRATQRFNLIDVGAVFLAGPIGLVASRGYAFTGLLEGSGGSTRIVELVTEWTIEGGVARARDVAFTTQENRLALGGGLDFARYRFADLKVAVLDRDGCAIVEQTITGSFDDPDVNQPNFLVAAAGPLLDLVESGLQAITGEECETFYSGSVAHP